MPKVLTIFNHGTNAHSQIPGELVAEMAKVCDGRQIQWGTEDVSGDLDGDFIVNEGPGATGETRYTPGQVNPFTGGSKSYDTTRAIKNRKWYLIGKKKSGFRQDFEGETSRNTSVSGLVSGAGWDDNVARVAYYVASMRQQPDVVNLVGWSRGAVTCLKIANKLQEVFPDIFCNIFAVDPVAGGSAGTKQLDTYRVPTTVLNYIGILSMHERRGSFKPQDLSRVQLQDPRVTNLMFLPMPGHHSSQVKFKKVYESAFITYHLAYRFLGKFGTRFTSSAKQYALPGPGIVLFYSKLVLNLDTIAKKATNKGVGNWVMGGFQTRSFTSRLGQYTQDSSYFVNEHHRLCFKRYYPNFYSYVFMRGPNPALREAALNELKRMPTDTRRSLASYYTEFSNRHYLIDPASGYETGTTLQTWPAEFNFLIQ